MSRSHFRTATSSQVGRSAQAMCEAAETRTRFRGSDDDLKEVYVKHATQRGRSFVNYAEDLKVAETSLDKAKIQAHHEVLHDLHKLQRNLCFVKSQQHRVLSEVVKTFGPKWRFSETQAKEWVGHITLRLRNICYVVSQGEKKSPQTSWVLSLPWNGKEDATEGKDEPKQGQQATGRGGVDPGEDRKEG